MKIWGVGYNWAHPSDFVCELPCGTVHETLLIIKSKALFTLDGKEYSVEPDTAIWIKANTPHSYRAVEKNYTDDYINFDINDQENEEFTNKYNIPPNTFIPLDYPMQISQLIKTLSSENLSNHPLSEEVQCLYTRLILCKISELSNSVADFKNNIYYPRFTELRGEIYSYPNGDWNVDIVAKKLNLSRSYAQHLYKTFFNVSINQDITSSRIEYAKHLLTTTNMSVSAVAEACRYNNDVHFIRIFKKITLHTPTSYKSQAERLLISYPPEFLKVPNR